MADDIGITISTRGGRQAAREAREVSGALGGIGRAATGAGRGVRALTRDTGQLGSRGFGFLRNQAQYAGLAVGGIGILAVKAGLQFNASMEQNELAFTNFLGSARAARRELAFLQQTAAKTPFELPQITQATRQLLAFGFPLRQANSLLGTLGDAAAGAGLGAEAIDQMVRAFGQIRGKGTLQAEELQQLGELGLVNREKLAKNLHITTAELADAGNQGISADRAIRALQKTLDDTFGGQAAKQARTFTGQLSTLRDNTNQLLGTITKPGFDRLRRQVLPALNDLSGALQRTWSGHGPRTTEMKLFQSRLQIQKALRPLEDEVGKLHLGDKFGDAVDAAAPEIGRAVGRAAPHAASAFVGAWMHSGPWAQFGTLAYGAFKLATFIARGVAMGRGFRIGWGTGVGTLPAPVRPPAPGGASLGRRFGKAFGLAAAAAISIEIGRGLVALSDQTGLLGGRRGRQNRGRWVDQHIPGMRQLRDLGVQLGIDDPLPRVRRGPGPATSSNRAATRAARNVPGFSAVIHVHSHLDGKEVANSVHRHASDARANRRGG